ncbi:MULTISPECIES: dephospho-CoA kinase [unclassified Duganella]|uniref:dephospho-CoA kinase n=1 Tax=unclassified Duganella TaxID=2636909 RepID=UPI0006FCC294|nr:MULTISPECIES: dephospho-CoA kinase [unclassified Duganella]KQV51170.1 dephospho-CoA kinase [Duganella sp. Root336D2]KRC03041.1 dephospho-CoA kinase [Duganella sp. Root198D2]
MPARFVVGLTGGIGSGKSLIANMFADRGASIVDTDQIAHALTGPNGAAMPDILAEFGPHMADSHGAMDRAKMRELVFREPAAKRRLEAILHPMIRDATLAAAADASGDYVMLAIPLLVESGAWKQRVNRVLVIDCPEEIQVARVMARNGLAEDQVRAIMATQVPRAVRLAAADDVIDNGGRIEALTPQVDHLHGFYQQYL